MSKAVNWIEDHTDLMIGMATKGIPVKAMAIILKKEYGITISSESIGQWFRKIGGVKMCRDSIKTSYVKKEQTKVHESPLEEYEQILRDNINLSYEKLADLLMEKHSVMTTAENVRKYFIEKGIHKINAPTNKKRKKSYKLGNPYMDYLPHRQRKDMKYGEIDMRGNETRRLSTKTLDKVEKNHNGV